MDKPIFLLSEGLMTIAMKFDEALSDRVEQLARSSGRSTESILDEALRSFVEREEQRERFRQEAEQSWSDYRSSGQHISGEEVRDWLATWGTPDEPDRPACHG